MPLTLTDADQRAIARAARALVSPLAHASTELWRADVNRRLRELLRADSAGFLLPDTDGPLLYSEEHDPGELAKYPDLEPPAMPDGSTLWEHAIAQGVSTVGTLYGAHVGLYTGSAYYNEYASPNGAHDTLCAMLPLGGADARSVASVQLWRNAGNPQRFGEREQRVLGLLFPALSAGVHAVGQWHRHRAALLGIVDALGQAALLRDARGRSVHETPALGGLLAADPERATLRREMQLAGAAVRSAVLGGRAGAPVATVRPTREVRTARARYRVTATLHGGPPEGGDSLVLVVLESLTPPLPSPADVRAAFGLTAAEARVALLLAEGRSNAAIALATGTTASTARRHTERVLQKLGVAGRAAVARRLAGGGVDPSVRPSGPGAGAASDRPAAE